MKFAQCEVVQFDEFLEMCPVGQWSPQPSFRTFSLTQKVPCLSCFSLVLAVLETALIHFELLHLLWVSGSPCFSFQWPQGSVSWDSFYPFPGSRLSARASSSVSLSSKGPKISVSCCQWHTSIYFLGQHGLWIAYCSFPFSSVFLLVLRLKCPLCIEKYILYLRFNFIIIREVLKICSQWHVWNSDT